VYAGNALAFTRLRCSRDKDYVQIAERERTEAPSGFENVMKTNTGRTANRREDRRRKGE
jgi:hypothetical protein